MNELKTALVPTKLYQWLKLGQREISIQTRPDATMLHVRLRAAVEIDGQLKTVSDERVIPFRKIEQSRIDITTFEVCEMIDAIERIKTTKIGGVDSEVGRKDQGSHR